MKKKGGVGAHLMMVGKDIGFPVVEYPDAYLALRVLG